MDQTKTTEFFPDSKLREVAKVLAKPVPEEKITQYYGKVDFTAIYTIPELTLKTISDENFIRNKVVSQLVKEMKYFFCDNIVKELEEIETEVAALPQNEVTKKILARICLLIKDLNTH